MEKLTILPPDLDLHWSAIAPIFSIRNEQEYEQAIKLLNHLIDEIGTNEQHPLYNLLDTLGILISAYEENNYEITNCESSDIFAYLMEEHNLCLSDFPEIGTVETIKAILNKDQVLTLSQISILAKRFNVNPQVFLT